MLKPLPESVLAPSISSALEALATAKTFLAEEVKKVQETCVHRFVSEAPYSSISPATRICNHCRFIEVGSHWSGGKTWNKSDYTKPALDNNAGRYIANISRETLWDMRISV